MIESKDLLSGGMKLGIELSPDKLTQFETFAKLLTEWNQQINLTRIPEEKYVTLHFLDSLTLAQTFRPLPKRILDVGSGAGFPGLPLAIAFPAINVTLMDGTLKRVRFLETVVTELGLHNVSCCHGRAELLAKDARWRNKFDFVTARAVAPLSKLVPWLSPFIAAGGSLCAMKGGEVEQEVAEAQMLLKEYGLDEFRIIEVSIPESDVGRKLIVAKRTITP